MRIGLFHSTLPESDRKIGGVEQFVHRLGNALVGRGHDVVVWTLSPTPNDAIYETREVGPARLIRTKVRRLLQVPGRLQRVSFSDRDVLHLHGDDWFFLRRSLPTIRTLHGSALLEARHATSTRRRVAQSLVFPAEIAASYLSTITFAGGPEMPRGYRIDGTLPYGFDDSKLDLTRSVKPSVLFVGTWEGRKRGRWLADKFAAVRAEVRDAELWMASDCAEPRVGVHHLGRPSDEELREFYARAWVFCLPSSYEGFGMPYVEAMIQGTPVIATSNPGSREVLAQGGGDIVSDGQLSGALVALLTSAQRRLQLSLEARRVSARYSWEHCIAAHEAAYERAIALWRGVAT